MQKSPVGIKNLTPARNLIKEFAGIPTYIGSALLAIKYTNNNLLIGTLVFLCCSAIYYYIYQYVFPKFDTNGKKLRLIIFMLIQTVFWVAVIVLPS